jgi:hypothetical protein
MRVNAGKPVCEFICRRYSICAGNVQAFVMENAFCLFSDEFYSNVAVVFT